MAVLRRLLSYGVPLRAMPADPGCRRGTAPGHQGRPAGKPRGVSQTLRVPARRGDYVFVHAGIRPGRSLENQSPQDLLWIRDDFLRSPAPLPGKVVVHGHTICDLPQDLGHRINIDTGAFVSGRLTALALRGGARRFLSTASEGARAAEALL